VVQVSEIARRTGLHLATASRLVAGLVGHGLLAREPDQRVRVGAHLWALRGSPTSRPRDTGMPFMEEVHAVVGHQQVLVVPRGENHAAPVRTDLPMRPVRPRGRP
jgi:DNA-binding IclR family transcriptional regulator